MASGGRMAHLESEKKWRRTDKITGRTYAITLAIAQMANMFERAIGQCPRIDGGISPVSENMPEMNGIQMNAELKASEQTKSIPVIMVTAMGTKRLIKNAKAELEVAGYILKPFDPEVLLNEVKKQKGLKARVIIPGTAAEYGIPLAGIRKISERSLCRPISYYGLVKNMQTTMSLTFAREGMDVTVGRVFNILGHGVPATLAMGRFSQQIASVEKRRNGRYVV